MLQSWAALAVFLGAASSLDLMLHAAQHPPRVLLVLFVVWVLSPFLGLLWGNVASKRWSVLTRAMLYVVTILVTIGSLAAYGHNLLRPPSAQAAFVFVGVPLTSWLVIFVVVAPAAFLSARRSRVGAVSPGSVEPEVLTSAVAATRSSGLRLFVASLIKVVAFLVALGIFAVAAAIASIWLELRNQITLPTPTGSFSVGRTTYAWSDDTVDSLAPVPGAKRELFVWIWYPSVRTKSAAPANEYLPAAWREALNGQGSRLFTSLTRDLSLVQPHSVRDPDVSPQERSYPVVIMRGGASSNVTNYSTLAEDLASHGYVVVGIDAAYRTRVVVFPDGRVITRSQANNPETDSGKPPAAGVTKLLAAWTADIGFVLDQLERLNTSDASGRFTGHLDMERVGVFGHSFGGAQAAQFCSEDSRCKAGIDIDGAPLGSVIETGLHKPFMFVLSAQIESSKPEARKVKRDIESIYDRLPTNGRFCVEIRGANHFTFSDDGALLKSYIVRWLLHLIGQLDINGRRQLSVTAYCVHSFFDAYLKAPSSKLELSSPAFPEIKVLEFP